RHDLQAYDKRHGVSGQLKSPGAAATSARGGKAATPKPTAKDAPFDGTPGFEKHKGFIGIVTAAEDAARTIDIRAGTVTGTVKLAEFERYNPQHLTPGALAPVGAHVRVSLLAPVPEQATTTVTTTVADAGSTSTVLAKVPLRLESGPEGALVAIDTRSRD